MFCMLFMFNINEFVARQPNVIFTNTIQISLVSHVLGIIIFLTPTK